MWKTCVKPVKYGRVFYCIINRVTITFIALKGGLYVLIH